jgi:hypothetical protein
MLLKMQLEIKDPAPKLEQYKSFCNVRINPLFFFCHKVKAVFRMLGFTVQPKQATPWLRSKAHRQSRVGAD